MPLLDLRRPVAFLLLLRCMDMMTLAELVEFVLLVLVLMLVLVMVVSWVHDEV